MNNLLGTNAKLSKAANGKNKKIVCLGLSLAPSTMAGGKINVCPSASFENTPQNLEECIWAIENGSKVSVPFSIKSKKLDLPDAWNGYPVDDGDLNDAWFLRSRPVQGLRFKGTKDIHGRVLNPALGCADGFCLVDSGRAAFWKSVNEARIAKTRLLFSDRKEFIRRLRWSIDAHIRKAEREGYELAIRLNTISDIPWYTAPFGEIMQAYPGLVFYDYSKVFKRIRLQADGKLPENYTLCFSYNRVWDHEENRQVA